MYDLTVGESIFEYEDQADMQVLRRAADAHANQDARRTVRLKSAVCSDHLPTVFADLSPYLSDAVIETTEHQGHYQVDLKRTIKRSDISDGQRTVKGSFAVFRNPETDIWMALTGSDPDFYKRGIKWLFSQAEPDVSEVYLNSSDLEQILDQLKTSLPFDAKIRVGKAVAYTRREEGTISFETNPYKEVFRVSRENDKYVDKIRFEVLKQGESVREKLLTANITRDGHLKFQSGDVGLFFNHLLFEYAEAGQRKADVLAEKQRSSETGNVEQIQVSFSDEVFHTPDDHDDLIEALGNLSKSSLTVYHENPYAHLSLLDFVDGSSCDIFVTEPDEVSIIPSYKGSVNSLMRISEQISREFDEGVVAETGTPEYGAEDFFAN